ncbi:vWA domain-containing protein [Thiorhodovibrio frisius]|uniref:hypothetical protein n=1 Tax=Thiorhodovibrio frisius TaxID=631362 RepID=UPI00117D1AD5|nr:hypothetical protein [Thiorhodovibrio frisius]
MYFVISGSPKMGKASFEAIWNRLHGLKNALVQDPYALETLYVSLIQASSDAWTKDPLTPIDRWRPSLIFPEGAGELALGAACAILDYRINQEVKAVSNLFQGDFCPLIVILINSHPTDDWKQNANSLLTRPSPQIASCATLLLGSDVHPSDFREVPKLNPIYFVDADSGFWRQFFRWEDQQLIA